MKKIIDFFINLIGKIVMFFLTIFSYAFVLIAIIIPMIYEFIKEVLKEYYKRKKLDSSVRIRDIYKENINK